jgi:hypothetical protein
MRLGLSAAVAAAAMAVAAPANAAVRTYAGNLEVDGRVAFEVKIKRGHLLKLTAIRMYDVPMTCAESGDAYGNLNLNGSVPIPGGGRFAVDSIQPAYGNVTTISGKFNKRRQVKGRLDVSYHYPAQDDPPYPEEDCSAGPLAFKATLGARDETLAPPVPKRGRLARTLGLSRP